MWFLFDHLEPGSFRTCYADTDSMAIATTKTAQFTENMTTEERYRCVFDPIVRPEMRSSWEQNWKKWFVTTNTIEDGLYPGKLKRKFLFIKVFIQAILVEFEFQKGRFIALSPKCYYAQNSNGEVKLGTKGLPHHIDVVMNDFKSCLETGRKFIVTTQSLTMKNNVMSRVSTTKNGLNRIFTKFRTEDDGITCKPLTVNNTYM